MPLCNECKYDAMDESKDRTCDECGGDVPEVVSDVERDDTLTLFQRIAYWFGLGWKTTWSGYVFDVEASPRNGFTVVTIHKAKVRKNEYTDERTIRLGSSLDRDTIHLDPDNLPNSVRMDKTEGVFPRGTRTSEIVVYNKEYVVDKFVEGGQDD
jgi:hypothetical protein